MAFRPWISILKTLILTLFTSGILFISPSNILAAPACSVSPATITAGSSITTNGAGLSPGINYTYTIKIGASLLNLSTTADGAGNFSDTRVINVAGTANVRLDLGLGGSLACGTVTVAAAPAPVFDAGKNPCASGTCNTAIGNNIPTNPTAFTGRLLTIAIGLAGGIALIIMVRGSIKILMASGDPQKITDGRDLIVAAIAGLLFLIFSVLILKFLGKDFLGLFRA